MPIAITGFYAALLVLIATVLAVAAIYYNSLIIKVDERVVDVDIQEIEDLKAAHASQLAAKAHWIDRDEGIVALPIDRAKELIVREYGGSRSVNAADVDAGVAPN